MTKQQFTELILENEEMMCKVAMSMLRNEKDCEDAMQTAILSAFEKLSTLKHEEYFRTWLQRRLTLINIPISFSSDREDADSSGYVTLMDATFIQRWLANMSSNDRIGKLL